MGIDSAVRLGIGTRVGRYEILQRIGGGGMGEVYCAVDTRLQKTVAVKIIASGYLDDPLASLRFERERQLTAALEHPHICRLLDAGQEDNITYLAMEFLDGEPLSKRLARGSIPPRQALGYAIELADALSYAHSHGVIHRDLKPANVHVTSTGLKVLDFGLAKLRPPVTPSAPQEDTAPLLRTTPGTLIGTAMYMAPERLEGAEADQRTDIFSFGLIVYEMLAGHPAFHGDSVAGLIADVMTADPPRLTACEQGFEEFEWVIRRCLMKAPPDRWQSMHDVCAILRRLAGRSSARRREAILRPATAAALALLLSGLAAWSWFIAHENTSTAPSIVFRVEPPGDGGFTPTANSVQSPMLALSPDGTSLAYVASAADGASQIWIRSFESLEARPLRGTEDAIFPFWSPNGRSLGFFSGGDLKRIDVAGGTSRRLAPAPTPVGGTWSASDVILFAPSAQGGLRRVSAHGGEVSDATQLDVTLGHTSHRWPRFIGDGSQYLFFARSAEEAREGIYLASLGSGAPRLLVNSDFAGDVLADGRLLYVSEGSLVAQEFNPRGGPLRGDPLLLAESIATSSSAYPAFSVSRKGVLAYAPAVAQSELTWFDRTGQALGVDARGSFVDFRLSPNNQYLALAQTDSHTDRPDLWVLDRRRGTSDRLTSSRGSDGTPTWSPDGRELLFRSNREGIHDLYLRAVFGTEQERPFLQTAAAKYPTSWSAASGTILFHSIREKTGWDVWAVPSDKSAPPKPLIQTRFNEAQAQLSPDGQWLAYAADEGSSFEVYVQPFAGGRRWPISIAGGSDPRWNANGSELFYVSADGWLMSVALSLKPDMQPAPPQRLFRMPDAAAQAPYTSRYDVAADGQRFLVRVPRDDVRKVPLTVMVHPPVSMRGSPKRSGGV